MDNLDSPPAANLRSKTRRAMAEERSGQPSTPTPNLSSKSRAPAKRSSPFLPTTIESLVLAAFPAILLFGTIYSVLSPQVRRAEYDPVAQAHSQDPTLSPSYFARKSNILNTVFVKKGWFWTTMAFAAFALSHPLLKQRRAGGAIEGRAATRWGLATAAWFLVTRWCFGPAIIDRSFRWTGGKCELVEATVAEGQADLGEFVSAVACKAAGGAWKGGHDISGHVFLLVLASGFLLQEVGWVWARYSGKTDDRTIVMADGALKSAKVEADTTTETTLPAGSDALGWGGKFALAVVGLSWWMLLMTAIYFHTWFEKVTGLLTALVSLYAIYGVPRFVPAIRDVVGVPGN